VARAKGQIDLFTRRVRKPPPAKEFASHVMVADTLKRWCRPVFRYTHIPNGELREDATAAKLKRMGVQPGWPDFAIIGPPPGFYALEMKRKGEKLTPDQEAFEAFCKSAGFPFETAFTYGQAIAHLTQWGVLRVSLDVLERER